MSCDFPIGIPYNTASYGLLLLIIAKSTGLEPRYLVGQLGDCHIYRNQKEGVLEQLSREPRDLPTVSLSENLKKPISFAKDKDYWKLWTHEDFEITGYDPHPRIDFEIAV